MYFTLIVNATKVRLSVHVIQGSHLSQVCRDRPDFRSVVPCADVMFVGTLIVPIFTVQS